MNIRKIIRIENLFLHNFIHKITGEIVSIAGSENSYRDLALKNARAPEKIGPVNNPNFSWLNSTEKFQFDTPTKWFDVGDVFEETDGSLNIKYSIDDEVIHIDFSNVNKSRDNELTIIDDTNLPFSLINNELLIK